MGVTNKPPLEVVVANLVIMITQMEGNILGLNRFLSNVKNLHLHHACKIYTEKNIVRILKRYKVVPKGNLIIKRNVFIEDYRNVIIGCDCAINKNVRFYIEGSNESKILIGDNVNIARDVIFDTGTHEIGASSRRAGRPTSKNIKVGNGTWIGIGAIILAGVSIGGGCIIQAGSVVYKDCKPNCIYGGNPAKLVMDLTKVSALR